MAIMAWESRLEGAELKVKFAVRERRKI
uniref:Uncharacterized protein MANES_11G087600 n=1 Tax=Rhizophora mucronata TaxID=61149 RepID=A0A2P2PAA2_RHIMU